ncbi:hypothetical protein WA158_007909 [Blastocystis sp. Blastoise]
MVSLKIQKRLAAAVLKCGKRKIWMDPNEISEISLANSRQNVRRLVKNGLVIRKADAIHSRARITKRNDAKSRGNHTGFGKRRGTRNARIPSKLLWMRRIRVLRRLLKKYREAGKIDKHIYASFYINILIKILYFFFDSIYLYLIMYIYASFYKLAKGNRYRTKRVLMENIHHAKAESKAEKKLKEEAEALRSAARARREKKAEANVAAKN